MTSAQALIGMFWLPALIIAVVGVIVIFDLLIDYLMKER